ncbi:hypothetical protein O0I10_011308 [Lichtheimia ornata]|uniref:Uncharacterized protein n=1 Tax=Lichtheimia ornata TaxID=688661 RepID=A0AAD7UTT7_9FUNG|nr:uncharacterized protein O0I10_011308 [Lichtheimia ornata]KAJ8653008.1 hypothetical protein O0I10_011308 [Lichtheimia ornata]
MKKPTASATCDNGTSNSTTIPTSMLLSMPLWQQRKVSKPKMSMDTDNRKPARSHSFQLVYFWMFGVTDEIDGW